MRTVGRRRSLISLLGVMLLQPGLLYGQRVAGVGDDAIPIPRGGIRYRIAANWNRYDEAFRSINGNMERRPLLDPLDRPSLDVSLLPQLAPAQSAIGLLTGSGFTIGLGALEARGEVQENITPLSVDYGVTRRLSVGLLVPYVEARMTTRFVLNRNGTGANVGQNPAWHSTGVAARAANGIVLRELATARSLLEAEVARCTATGATDCDIILGNLSNAQSLLERAGQVQGAVATVYGDSVRGGSFVAPIAGSQTQVAVESTISTLREDFAFFGIDAIGENSLPAGATTVIGPGGFSRIVQDTALGLGYNSMGNARRAGIGDIDLTGTFLLYDSFAADQARRLAPSGTNIRSSITAGWRFGSANAHRTSDPFDIPTGDGANALLVRSTTDLIVGRWFWISGTARASMPLADNVAIALPFATDSTTLYPFTVAEAQRTLGTRIQLELAPRFALGEFFGLSAAYQMRRHSEDRYATSANGPGLGNTVVVAPRSLHAVAVAFTYSSMASYSRGRSRIPVEVIYSHSEPIAASGSGTIPAVATDRLELRIYTGFPRR